MNLKMYQRQPNGKIEVLQDETKSSYDLIKTVIEETFDVARFGELDMYVDDSGLLKQMTPNIIIKRSQGNQLTEYDTLLVGPIVFASHNDEGDTISVTENAKEIINSMTPVFMGSDLVYLIKAY